MAQFPGLWEGGSNSFKAGSLKRRLPAVTVARLDSSMEGNTDTIVQRAILKNLNGDLNIQLVAAFGGPADGQPITPDLIAAGAATMQLTPVVDSPNAGKIYLRPVFQDPSANQNENHPLPQDLPFGWEFQTEADEVYIDITMSNVLFSTTNLEGQILLQATVEYNGAWQNIEAIRYAISQVQLTGLPLQIIGTEGG